MDPHSPQASIRRILIALSLPVVVGCATLRQPKEPARAHPLPFIEDDYPAALEQAKKLHRPLFVESWAPW